MECYPAPIFSSGGSVKRIFLIVTLCGIIALFLTAAFLVKPSVVSAQGSAPVATPTEMQPDAILAQAQAASDKADKASNDASNAINAVNSMLSFIQVAAIV